MDVRKASQAKWVVGKDAILNLAQSYIGKVNYYGDTIYRLDPKIFKELKNIADSKGKKTLKVAKQLLPLIDAYEAYLWFSTEEVSYYNALYDAIYLFRSQRNFANCLGVCIAGSSYISSIPEATGVAAFLLAEWFEKKCSQKCCENY